MADKEIFETADINCASYLSLVLEVMPRYDWSSGRCYFLFDKTDTLNREFGNFIEGKDDVSSQDYHQHFAKVRTGMFAARPKKMESSRAS